MRKFSPSGTVVRPDGTRTVRRQSPAPLRFACVVLGAALVAGFAGIATGQVPTVPNPSTTRAASEPASAEPEQCEVGAYVTALNELDFVKRSFYIEFWAWAIAPTRVEPLRTVEVLDASKVETSHPYAELSERRVGGAVVPVHYSALKFAATIRHDWASASYPFDRHTLDVELEDTDNDMTKVVFTPDLINTRAAGGLQVDGWQVTGVRIRARPQVYDTTFGDPKLTDGVSRYSRLILSIDIRRQSRMGFWKLTAGVYVAFALSLLSYFYDSNQTSMFSARSSVLVGTLFAVLVNLRATETVLGHTEGLTLVDKIHVITICSIFVGAMASVTSRWLVDAGHPRAAIVIDRRILFPAVLTIYVVLNAVMIASAMHAG